MISFEKLSSRIINYENTQKIKLSKSIKLGAIPMVIFLALGVWLFFLGGYVLGGIFIAIICFIFWVYFRSIALYETRIQIHKILISAKSEVSKHISGTTELDQVSELQKIRLNRQIEQFEELQRVLVKI